ncbi:TfoX/Sxy family protein [Pseudomonas sp. LP_7_YM]|uniref:TfoX/Sxy family protein n=1 Tax=Pseudomonas sp. LP_7_YM TaxID=2485137 RepID=UPI00105CA6F7|nr:TfoX/Sxy family protein [Pseudomonas sp. LP_7_YM]TDV61929.1 DNA transformation protein [Pseudomonas sp. LP_7_YM]
MEDELLQMKNLGKTTTQWLHAAGIHNAADLRRLGAIHAYQAIRTRGFRTSRTLLYAIEGALRDKDWLSLSATEKALLNQQLASPEK